MAAITRACIAGKSQAHHDPAAIFARRITAVGPRPDPLMISGGTIQVYKSTSVESAANQRQFFEVYNLI